MNLKDVEERVTIDKRGKVRKAGVNTDAQGEDHDKGHRFHPRFIICSIHYPGSDVTEFLFDVEELNPVQSAIHKGTDNDNGRRKGDRVCSEKRKDHGTEMKCG